MSDDELRQSVTEILESFLKTIDSLLAAVAAVAQKDTGSSDSMFIGALITALDMTYRSGQGAIHVINQWKKLCREKSANLDPMSVLDGIKTGSKPTGKN